MKTVALSPHNDDVELFACYETLRHDADVIVCLRSARMGTPGYPPPLVDHQTRERETAGAMDVLGLDWGQWEFLDSQPDWDALRHRLEGLAAVYDHAIAPAVEVGGHEHHNRIGLMALDAFEKVTPYLTYTYPSTRSTGGSRVEPQDGWPELKLQALSHYDSQATHPMTWMHFRAPLDEYVL